MIAPLHFAPMRSSAQTRCRACGAGPTTPFAWAARIPVNNARVFVERADALGVATGDMELCLCPDCGFVGNALFDPQLVVYGASYEEQQSFSPVFTAFSDWLAADLVERWNLAGKRVIEIGCGKGDFLATLCASGVGSAVGIDPTAVPGRLAGPGSERVTLVPELFEPRPNSLDADAIVCRHTLEHISDVAAFLHGIRRSIDDRRRDCRVFLEVPDALRVLQEGAYWDVYYEHCSYFTPGSLARLFRQAGFVVERVGLAYDHQYILLEARLGDPSEIPPRAEEDDPHDVELAAANYVERTQNSRARWRRAVGEVVARGGRVAIWGSGSKCVSFLHNTLVGDDIAAVVDVNPHRHGRYLPATGKRIASPEELRTIRPELVIAMNPIYRDEIAAALEQLGVPATLEAV